MRWRGRATWLVGAAFPAIVVAATMAAAGCGPSTKPAPRTATAPAGGGLATDAGGAVRANEPDAPASVDVPPNLPRVTRSPESIASVSVGDRHSCALYSSGRVRCWGYGGTGGLGTGSRWSIGDDEPWRAGGFVALKRRVVRLSVGMHTCAIVEGGSLHCWGPGRFGRLGYGNTSNVGDDETPASVGAVNAGGKVIDVAAGAAHTCALLAGGKVRCWGRGASGRLGYANTNDVGDDETPASVGPVDVGGKVARIYAGGDHSCALLAGGTVRCWGANNYGQLGYGHTNPIGDDETPASAGDVDVGGTVIDLALGGSHTCALLAGGRVRCWGWGGYGQLGYGKRRSIGDNEVPARAGDVDVGGKVVALAAGNDHTCALLGGGAVTCWGQGLFGALGYGNNKDIGDNEKPSKAGPVAVGGKVVGLSAGGLVTCARLAGGAVSCWGQGRAGALGRGDTRTIGDDETPASAGKGAASTRP